MNQYALFMCQSIASFILNLLTWSNDDTIEIKMEYQSNYSFTSIMSFDVVALLIIKLLHKCRWMHIACVWLSIWPIFGCNQPIRVTSSTIIYQPHQLIQHLIDKDKADSQNICKRNCTFWGFFLFLFRFEFEQFWSVLR